MGINVNLGGNASGAVKGILDLNKALDQTEEKLDLSTKEAKQLERQARRVSEQADPQRRYNRQLQELATLVRQGKVELSDAERVAQRYANRMERAARANKDGFGSRAIGDLRGWALGLIGVSNAINLVVQGFRNVREEQERAQQAQLQARAGVGELAQLAATQDDPQAAYARLLQRTRRARAIGAADTQQEAANLVFALESAGLSAVDQEFALQLRSRGVLQNVGGAATAFSALTSAVGREEVGSFEDFISKSLRASAIAPALANQIPQAATRAGGSARALGITDESLLAGVALLGKTAGTAELGGTQLASFLKQVEIALPANPELAGKNLVELVKYIDSLDESQKGFGGILGKRAEAIQGFRTLAANIDTLQTLRQGITEAAPGGLAQVALGLPQTDAQQRAALQAAASQGALEIQMGEGAALQNLLDAALDERTRVAIARGDTQFQTFNRAIEDLQVEMRRLGGMTPEMTESILRELVGEGRIQDPQLLQNIADALGDQTIALTNIDAKLAPPAVTGARVE